ncbi:B12-binding domain-containing radical SAM protein [Pseudorhodoplanes sinuspersici]|uniref:B12-binding domain-containing radical SAM protein n=1 Tax=Pseudorhodoplanes sinuspersici TaxID=1235591 RepID=A0A1W6ZY23_9HYPH|nr:B12-binding domain-containing radical SAM protein [Pseudorhodoplanes sinuspersici]ARQ02297.1 B12-binding domain-containing radical SAM protein [Pseudorhodoplanes sinuspersici]RKE74125.1 radical SAM superfamily enzyme YgiQ (UPF0313 family) [Pseudorhodoplanes sinuspersici]
MTINVLMVFPKFNPNSFWSMPDACDVWGAKCVAPPLGLITVAALLPPDWRVRLVDCNARNLTDDDIDWADMVMTGGMLPQQIDALKVIDRCQERGKTVVVGGPDATSSPEIYDRADMLVLGEAEGVIDRFIEAWIGGARSGVFEAEKFKVDVTRTPIPRFDLLNPKDYLYLGIQFSRGCPFNCEFCDIIELYGRVPRSKTNAQMLAELEALYQRGYRGHVDFVDDNLVGNKKALKIFLPALIQWQQERGYPFRFSTEASINLADDTQLLHLMSQANFFAIFVGIESSDTETLVSTQKKQNTRRSIADSIHRIYGAGMFVTAGFIVGFDTEKDNVATQMIACIEATSIPWCMVGLLTALPNTQLTRRLEKEGRFFGANWSGEGDQCTGGLNFTTLRPRREIWGDYRAVLETVYEPAAFFERVRRVGRAMRRPALSGPQTAVPQRKSKLAALRGRLKDYRALGRVMWRMTVRRPDLRRHFWRTFLDCAKANPAALDFVVMLMVVYLHLGTFAQSVIAELDRKIERDRLEAEPAASKTLQIA